ncbi:hypothetical protein AVEN_243830-1 [Araneus ventricosus]|uniref:Uncharacterized protein n=1 Tax=Araneus ventricosus TaxID=182803 RepID=A0A4Y2A5T2_ARAVE|nr:hypothetical protein AVEN_243830-1 [Araneus ventricosus]
MTLRQKISPVTKTDYSKNADKQAESWWLGFKVSSGVVRSNFKTLFHQRSLYTSTLNLTSRIKSSCRWILKMGKLAQMASSSSDQGSNVRNRPNIASKRDVSITKLSRLAREATKEWIPVI